MITPARNPEWNSHRCPSCGKVVVLNVAPGDPSNIPCPACGCLIWFNDVVSFDPHQADQGLKNWVTRLINLSRTATDAESYFQELVSGTSYWLAALGGALWLRDANSFALRTTVGLSLPSTQSLLADRHQRVIEQAFAHNEGLLLPPQEELPGSGALENPTGALLLLGPIKCDGQSVAIVEILRSRQSSPMARRGCLRFLCQMCELASESRLFGD